MKWGRFKGNCIGRNSLKLSQNQVYVHGQNGHNNENWIVIRRNFVWGILSFTGTTEQFKDIVSTGQLVNELYAFTREGSKGNSYLSYAEFLSVEIYHQIDAFVFLVYSDNFIHVGDCWKILNEIYCFHWFISLKPFICIKCIMHLRFISVISF